MGQSGPLTNPDSIRGQKQKITFDEPETVTAPKWLSRSAKAKFKTLVSQLTDANVPIKAVDCHAISQCAYCLNAIDEWSEREQQVTEFKDKIACSKEITRYQRDVQKWLEMIAASPAARARLGLKAKEKTPGAVAQLLALKKHNAE